MSDGTEFSAELLYQGVYDAPISRDSAVYRDIVNDSLPFYFIDPYRECVRDLGDRYLGPQVDIFLNHPLWAPTFVHAIDARFAKGGKLLPGAILPVLQHHANFNARLYPGRVFTITQDIDSDITCHDDQNEVVLVVGTPDDIFHVHGHINTKSLVVLGCSLIVDGAITASDHIYVYGLGLKAYSITGNVDAICVSFLDTVQPYEVGPHSTLAVDTNPKLELERPSDFWQCLQAAGWISAELRARCEQEDNNKRLLEAATIKSSLIENIFKQDRDKQDSAATNGWSHQAMDILQWLQHPSTTFAELRQFALVGRCGIELPVNDPELQEEFRYQLIGALTEPESRDKLERAWQLCSKLVDKRPPADRTAQPQLPNKSAAQPARADAAVELDAADYEVLSD